MWLDDDLTFSHHDVINQQSDHFLFEFWRRVGQISLNLLAEAAKSCAHLLFDPFVMLLPTQLLQTLFNGLPVPGRAAPCAG